MEFVSGFLFYNKVKKKANSNVFIMFQRLIESTKIFYT